MCVPFDQQLSYSPVTHVRGGCVIGGPGALILCDSQHTSTWYRPNIQQPVTGRYFFQVGSVFGVGFSKYRDIGSAFSVFHFASKRHNNCSLLLRTRRPLQNATHNTNTPVMCVEVKPIVKLFIEPSGTHTILVFTQ